MQKNGGRRRDLLWFLTWIHFLHLYTVFSTRQWWSSCLMFKVWWMVYQDYILNLATIFSECIFEETRAAKSVVTLLGYRAHSLHTTWFVQHCLEDSKVKFHFFRTVVQNPAQGAMIWIKPWETSMHEERMKHVSLKAIWSFWAQNTQNKQAVKIQDHLPNQDNHPYPAITQAPEMAMVLAI